ncbi:MAG: HEAT repeat domain-containing protein [Deltaproteobacteria bacterium]|nr:HEAT repeat domain-containing protein [Deltaproteobacteria bacterium]
MVTSYFLIIPPVVFAVTLRWTREGTKKAWLNGIIHFVPIILLALVWASQLGNYMFVDIRDNLLLSNPLGRMINNFYYEYTFYPAEVFKPLSDKTLKTCNLEAIKQESTHQSLEKALRNHDYLNVDTHKAVDLHVAQEGKELLLQNKGATVLRITLQDFFSRPSEVLREFSSKIDTYIFFRQFTFLSLLVGFPVALYVVFQALMCAALSLFLTPRTSSVIATAFCFLFGILLLIPVHLSKAKELDVQNLSKALESERWQDRVAALKIMQDQPMDVATFRTYQEMRASPHIAERYWLARALGVSRQSETYDDLIAFLDDPSPNVVSMAFYALGKRGDRRAIKEIMTRIEASDNWYNQWYAYKALRKLGWKQNRSKQKR